MAICKFCNGEMIEADDCSANRKVKYADGTTLDAMPYKPDDNYRCGDCNIEPGNYHHIGCDMERCPRCKGQMLSCSCELAGDEAEPERPKISVEEVAAWNARNDNDARFVFDHPEAKGVITCERSTYGLDVQVNGKPLLHIDLFYLSEEADKSDIPAKGTRRVQVCTGRPDDDYVAHITWREDRVEIESLLPNSHPHRGRPRPGQYPSLWFITSETA